MRLADAYTLKSKKISSVDLMEQAAASFVQKFISCYTDRNTHIHIFCGKGNNGGDGLAIARLVFEKNYPFVTVYVLEMFSRTSEDFEINIERLKKLPVSICTVKTHNDIPNDIDFVIDAILGSGFQGNLEGELKLSIHRINSLSQTIVSVDCPSGFESDHPTHETYNGIRASHTICFQRPKLGFLLPESAEATACFDFVDIGLDEDFIQSATSSYYWIEEKDISKEMKPRKAFSHKGTYGHVLLVAGTDTTMGAAILAAQACIYTGAGLTTLCVPYNSFQTVNITLPEAMTITSGQISEEGYEVIAVGPGLGTHPGAVNKVNTVLQFKKPLILDADALNIISVHNLQHLIPPKSIITPHIKEFDRLFGTSDDWLDRLHKAQKTSIEMDIIIVLKNRYTFICTPKGAVFVNPTGNPAMAQGGMGDVLTGTIAAFRAQGFSAEKSAIMGCYVHGRSGDILYEKQRVIPAGQLAEQLTKTLKYLEKK